MTGKPIKTHEHLAELRLDREYAELKRDMQRWFERNKRNPLALVAACGQCFPIAFVHTGYEDIFL